MYQLHGFCQSGNTFKVAFLLRALHQAWEPKFVDFMNGGRRTGEWREGTNEMGEVPVLDDGDRHPLLPLANAPRRAAMCPFPVIRSANLTDSNAAQD